MSSTKVFASRTDRLRAMNDSLDGELSRLAALVGASNGALLTEMVQYQLGLRGARRGKRLRANLALLTCEAMGRRYADAMWAAAAIELVHNFSLLFDDVQDRDPVRRGSASAWKVWGAGQAINAGAALEALVTRAVLDLMPARHLDRLRPALLILNEAMLALCRGQVLDLQFEQRVDVTVAEYTEMIGLKTAALFECAARLGVTAAGGGHAAAERAAAFGRHLGLAYQVIDDLRGIFGTARELGRPAGSDLRNGKKTLPLIVGLAGAAGGPRRQLRTLLTAARFSAPELATARGILAAAGAPEICRRQAAEHLAEARLNLFRITERPNWALRALADMVTTLEEGLS